MIELVEKFKCACGANNFILWKQEEEERTLPCVGCYGEEWTDVVDKTEWSEDKQMDVVVARHTVKTTHGVLLRCIKGLGTIVRRASDTKVEERF